MKTKLTLFLFFCVAGFAYAQSTPLNQLDSAGKKDGKWMVYLDKTWKEVKDSSDAEYYRYTYYEHGVNLYPMGTCGRKGWILAVPAGSSRNATKLTLLDGEYEWHDKKGRLNSAHSFNKGEYVYCKDYYPSGKLEQHFDYTMKWNEQPHTWHITIYDKKDQVKKYYFRKGPTGWMGYAYSLEKK